MIAIRPSPQSNAQWDAVERAFRALASPERRDVEPVAEMVRATIYENFLLERAGSSGGNWAPLAQSTILERIRLGYGGAHPILVRTGDFRASYTDPNDPDHVTEIESSISGWRLQVGSDDERAPWLEAGTRRIPARPVSVLGDTQAERVGRALDRLVETVLAR